MAYTVQTATLDRVVVVRDREIDAANASVLGTELCAEISLANGGRVIVDMSGVSFIDSQTLRMMDDVERFADANRCAILWRGLQEQAERVLEVTGRRTFLSVE
jgi:anti-anti-sigma factor